MIIDLKPVKDYLNAELHAYMTATQEPPILEILYVGDDLRDIQAGKSAGMKTIAVRWGYLGVDDPIETWGADWIIDAPTELIDICST